MSHTRYFRVKKYPEGVEGQNTQYTSPTSDLLESYKYTDAQWEDAKAILKKVRNKNKDTSIKLEKILYWYAKEHQIKATTSIPFSQNSYGPSVSWTDVVFIGDKQVGNPRFLGVSHKAVDSAKEVPNGGKTDPDKVTRASMKENCRWNLPPHAWSLPYMDADAYGTSTLNPERRARIFYYSFSPEAQKPTVMSQNSSDPGGKPTVSQDYAYTSGDERKYGFQFLWNPESYATNTSLQAEVTPSKEDLWVSGAGLFPGVESISFTVRLDRTNDFACFRKMYQTQTLTEMDKQNLIDTWYKDSMPKELDKTVDRVGPWTTSKLDWLMKYGTLADLEYLYRTFTDINIVNKRLADGFVSADVGYIGFFLVCVEVGPVYYFGYVTGVSVNHLTFTEDYIPIRSDVTIQLNIMANGSDMAGIGKGVKPNADELNPSGVTSKSPTAWTTNYVAGTLEVVPVYPTDIAMTTKWGGVDV